MSGSSAPPWAAPSWGLRCVAPSWLGPSFATGFSLRVARLPSVVVARRSGAPGFRGPSSSFPFYSTLASTSPGTDFLRHLITRLPSSEPVLKTALPETASLLHATPPFAPAANPNPPNRQKPGPTGLPSPVLSRWAARESTSPDQTASKTDRANQANREHVECHPLPLKNILFFPHRGCPGHKMPCSGQPPGPVGVLAIGV